MPIYAYRCEACGFAKDVLQKMSDPVLTECPSCSKSTFKKQLTAAGFQLKGTGWYVTDFRNNGSAPAASGSSGASNSASAASTTTTPNASDSSSSSTSSSSSDSSASTSSSSASGTSATPPASAT